jgi:hypothetical protein
VLLLDGVQANTAVLLSATASGGTRRSGIAEMVPDR